MKILGIDPAWSPKNPSGVALVERKNNQWICTRLAPSFDMFCEGNNVPTEMFARKAHGGKLELDTILKIAKTTGTPGEVNCIVVDIPIAVNNEIFGGRCSDRKISEAFGKAKCATYFASETLHSCLKDISTKLMNDANRLRYVHNTSLIETYPHPAIMSLMPDLTERLQYKVGKCRKYWPMLEVQGQRERLVKNMMRLKVEIGKKIKLPDDFTFEHESRLSLLKSYEDVLDALVCAWVGIQFMDKQCTSYGDENSTIWIPNKKHVSV